MTASRSPRHPGNKSSSSTEASSSLPTSSTTTNSCHRQQATTNNDSTSCSSSVNQEDDPTSSTTTTTDEDGLRPTSTLPAGRTGGLGEDGQKHDKVPAYNFSFAMGGWLMIYNFGVAKCISDHGLHAVHPKQGFIGSSAGSLAAAALVLEADIDKIVRQVKTSFIPRAHAAKIMGFVYGIFYIGTFLKESMLECLPTNRVPDMTPPGRLIVVMSSLLGWISHRATDFRYGKELVDALRCSCAVFPLVMPHHFRGKAFFDGFFSEGTSAPVLTEEEAGGLKTVTISPLYASSASIRPSRYVPLSWIALAPRDPGAVDWLYDLGYRDALFWMAKEGIEHTCAHDHQHPAGSARLEDEYDTGGIGNSSRSSSESSNGGIDDDGGVAFTLAKGPLTVENVDEWNSAEEELPSPSVGTSGAESPSDSRNGTDDAKSAPADGHSNGGPVGERQAGAGKPGSESTTIGGDGVGVGCSKKDIKRLPEKGFKRKTGYYVRKSFVLSGCHMRPRRDRHPQLDEPLFVPSLEQFVGHGSYNVVADFVFVVFFNIVWRPAAALLIYADLTARLVFAVTFGTAKEILPLLRWAIPTVVLAGVTMEHRPSRRESLAALATLLCIVAVRARREGAPSAGEWRRARKIARILSEYRMLLSCLPWGHQKDNVRSEALETSLLYRAVSVFM